MPENFYKRMLKASFYFLPPQRYRAGEVKMIGIIYTY